MFKDPFKEKLICEIKNMSFNPMLHIAPFFTDETQENIKKFKENVPSSVDIDEWKTLCNKYINDPLMLYAMLNTIQIPIDIVHSIVNHELDVYNAYHSEYTHEKHMSKILLFKAMEHPLAQHKTEAIFKTLNQEIMLQIQEYNNKNDPELIRYNPCPFSQTVLMDLGNIVLPYKKYKQRWYQQPFRLIKNEPYLESVLNNSKCNETVRESIVNNTMISDEMREKAFDGGVNFSNVIFAPLSVKDTIYESAISSYTELSVNPATRANRVIGHSKDDIKTYNNTTNFLQNKLSNNFFEESQQLDMVYRLRDLHGGKSKDWILAQIFKHTESPEVLKLAEEFKTSPDVEVAYQNKNMYRKLVLDRVEEILKKLERNYSAKLSESKQNTITSAMNNIVLSDKNYYDAAIHSNSNTNNFRLIAAQSIKTPIHILNAIIDRCDYLVQNRRDLGKVDEAFEDLLKEVKFTAILNKCIKGYIDPQYTTDWMNLFNCFKLTARTIVPNGNSDVPHVYKVVTDKKDTPKNDIQFIEWQTVNEILPSEVMQNKIISALEIERDKFEKGSEFYVKLQEIINEICSVRYTMECVNTEKYEDFNLAALNFIKKQKIRSYCKDAENDVSKFYDNFKSFLKEYSKVQFQIDLKELEKERADRMGFER